ncbi:hypothetical protein [Nesterenkonia flava]|uniref:Peptidase C-terminal archaeal/bacterial domain-containing protein n=1 Tax=Nesterenkonia flava TaxID=469799 RepID=A0ABU1FT41_9MICC|nr:hypothetical protein [Nesterenkonia flava]MDR5711835.1 hypothetical protein [Nesterenkonia flava]
MPHPTALPAPAHTPKRPAGWDDVAPWGSSLSGWRGALLGAFTVLVLLASMIAAPPVQASSTVLEREPNNNTQNAQVVNLGDTVHGSFSTRDCTQSDCDIYRFSATQAGRVQLDLRFADGLGTSGELEVRVLGAQGNALLDTALSPSDHNGARLHNVAVYVPAGTFYVSLKARERSVWWNQAYQLTATLAPARVENEPNNSTATATAVGLGQTIQGAGITGDCTQADCDYFRVNLSQASRLSVDFQFPCHLGTDQMYTVTLLDQNGTRLAEHKPRGSDCNGKALRESLVSAPAGNFYVYVKTMKRSPAFGKAYSLTVNGLVTPVTPTVSGTVKVGSTLTAQPGTWSPSGTALTYQWLRDGKAIKGATKSTYKLGSADAGKKVSVKVTGTRSGYRTGEATSKTHSVPLQTFTATPAPTLSGTTKVGSTLTAKPGTWAPGDAQLGYQWLRDGKAIKGATKSTYRLKDLDAGKKVSVRVTGAKNGYASVAKTSGTRSVPMQTLTAVPTPTVSGTAKVGASLKAAPGTWGPKDTSLSYQWLREGKAIMGATKSTYKLSASDAGKKVSVRVTGKKTGYASQAKTSKAATVPLQSFSRTPTPKITGSTKVGSTLKAQTGSWRPSDAKLSYQWLRDGKVIKKATRSSYTLTRSDVGKRISVRVTATKSGYKDAAKTSRAVSRIAR